MSQQTKRLQLIEEELKSEGPAPGTPWYKDGLRFGCIECGKCCTGAPGYVWVTPEEMNAIADLLGISMEVMLSTYVRRVGSRYALLESSNNYDCIFLKDNRCSIYQARPVQCRTYPFWPRVLRSESDWKNEAFHCEGIRSDAPLVTYSVIEENLSQQVERDSKK